MSAIEETIQAFREAAVRGDELPGLRPFGCEAVGPLVGLLGDDDPRVRRAALEDLVPWTDDERIVDALIVLLDDSVPDIRLEAVKLLRYTRHVRAVEPLLEVLGRADARLRKRVVTALVRIGGEQAVRALEHILREDPRPSVRDHAARELGRAEICEPLIAAWKDGVSLPAEVLPDMLSKIGDDDSRPRLIELLRHGVEWSVRKDAARALRDVGGPDAIDALKSALSDPHWWVQIEAAGALRRLGDSTGVDILIHYARNGSMRQCDAAMPHMQYPPMPEALDLFIDMLRHKRKRMWACFALGDLEDPRAIDPLIKALEDGSTSAALALGRFKEPRVIDALVRALGQDDWEVRMRAMNALMFVGDSRAIGPLSRLLRTGTQLDKWEAADALGWIGDPTATDVLVEALASDDARLRQIVAGALARMHTPRADEALVDLLARHDLDAIHGAYEFFLERNVPGSEGALVEALNCDGTRSMALDFVKSGNEVLAQAGREWFAERPGARQYHGRSIVD